MFIHSRKSEAPRASARGIFGYSALRSAEPAVASTLLRTRLRRVPAPHSSTALQPWLSAKAGKTIAGTLLVFAAAILLRLPYVGYPPDVVFDENLNTSFASYYFHKKPFFDYHAPLAPMIFSAALWGKNVPLIPVRDVASPQGDFPYIRLRTLNAIAGSLLAAVIFLIAALMYHNLWFAALPASFVVFDNALVAYSRAILPETLILLFGFSGILCWMLSDDLANNGAKQKTFWKSGWGRGQSRLRDWGVRISKMSFVERYLQNLTANILLHRNLFLAAAFLWALAASMKLTGLGFLLTASLFLFYRKQYAKIVVSFMIFALVYTAVFFAFFFTIQDTAPPYTYFRSQEVQKIDFSTPKTVSYFIPFIIQYHRAAFAAHAEAPIGLATHPLQWPWHHRPIGFWGKSNSERVSVSGNMIIWILTTLAVLVSFVSFVFQKKNMRGEQKYWLGTNTPVLPLVGYLANYIPFLLVPRALYLYHYFAALIFGFLLLPVLVQFFTELVVDETSQKEFLKSSPPLNRADAGLSEDGIGLAPTPILKTSLASHYYSANKIALALILLAILWYIILIPRTYGIPFYSMI